MCGEEGLVNMGGGGGGGGGFGHIEIGEVVVNHCGCGQTLLWPHTLRVSFSFHSASSPSLFPLHAF